MRPEFAAKLPDGAEQLAPGIYAAGNELHIDAVEMCESMGCPATPENQAVAADAARHLAAEWAAEFEEHDADERSGG